MIHFVPITFEQEPFQLGIPRQPRMMKSQMNNILEIDALHENGAQNGRSVVRLCAYPNAA